MSAAVPPHSAAGDPPLPRTAVAILAGALAVVVGSYVVAHLGVTPPAVRFLDNLHWITAHGAAAALAWLGVRSAAPEDRSPRRWFARGLTFYAIGEIVYGLQIATGWNPFPGPADLLTLLAGPCCWAGIMACLRTHGSAAERRQVVLDAAALSVAVLVLTLALYIPRRGETDLLTLAVMTAYPVGLLTAACFGLMLVPSLHLQRNRGTLTMVAALILMGCLWMRWNSLALDNRLEDGSWFNAVFSLGALSLGLGAMRWRSRPAPSPAWERRFEAGRQMLPLMVVICAAAAVVVATAMPGVPKPVRILVVAGAGATVLLAVARQQLLLAERNRLLGAERALREAERKFKTLFETATDAMVLLDGGRFLDCNPSTLRLFGGERAWMLGRSLLEFSPQQQPDGSPSAEALPSRMEGVLRGQPQFFEWRFRRADGADIDAEVCLNLLETDPHPLVHGSVRDVSDRRRAEATRQHLEGELQQARRLEAIGRLAGGVAHDFNNLLTVILGNTELVLGQVEADWPGRLDLLEIQRSGQRAADLTFQLLAFARKQVIAPVPVDLNRLIGNAVRMLERLIGAQVTLQFVPGPALGRVCADPTQVDQILMNLAINARDAMPNGGRLHIETANVELDAATARREPGVRPGPFVRLAVRDSGDGMDADTMAHLFEPFFTTKEQGKGTGLGLSTVYGVVRQSGGLIQVESAPGRGTAFIVYFPRLAEQGGDEVEDQRSTGTSRDAFTSSALRSL